MKLKSAVDAFHPYDDKKKKDFHAAARAALKRLALELKLDAAAFDLRSNKAGIAVSGEVTLHADRLYIQISAEVDRGGSMSFMWRTCDGRKDYCGHTNQWAPVGVLDSQENTAALARAMLRAVNALELKAAA